MSDRFFKICTVQGPFRFWSGNSIPDQVLFRVGHAVWTTVFGNAVVYYCARKLSSFSVSGDAVFSVLTPVVTEARNLKKVLFKGDWSQSR